MTQEILKPEKSQIAVFNEFETQLAKFKDRYENVVYDLNDPAQEKIARSDRLDIGRSISKLDSSHKKEKAPLKLKTDLLDSERKRIKDDLKGLQDKIIAQITEHERKIQEHAEMLQQKVYDIENNVVWDIDNPPSLDCLKVRVEAIESLVVDDTYEHRKADATLAQIDTLKALRHHLGKAEALARQEEELERLRKVQAEQEQSERERKIAEDARVKAENDALAERQKLEQDKLDAEKAAKQSEIDKAEAAELAEKEKVEAEEKAKRDQEQAVEKERKAAEDRELKRIADETEAKRQVLIETERREKNKKHRAKINNEALDCLVAGGMNKTNAKLAISLIAKKEVEHVTISY